MKLNWNLFWLASIGLASAQVFAASDVLICRTSDRTFSLESEFEREGSDFSTKMILNTSEAQFFSKTNDDGQSADENAKASIVIETGLKVITMNMQTIKVGAESVKLSVVAKPSSIQSQSSGGVSRWLFSAKVVIIAPAINSGRKLVKTTTCTLTPKI